MNEQPNPFQAVSLKPVSAATRRKFLKQTSSGSLLAILAAHGLTADSRGDDNGGYYVGVGDSDPASHRS